MLLGAALGASLSFAGAQQAVAPSVPASASSVDAMQLYLVAHDRRDRPIIDLKPGDLTITDDGTPVRLDNLRLVDQRQEPKQLVSFVFDPFPAEKDERPQKNSSRIDNAREAAMKVLSMLSESGFEFSVFDIGMRLRLQQGFTTDLKTIETAIHTATGPLQGRGLDHPSAAEKEMISVAVSGADSTGKRVTTAQRLQAQAIYAALKNSTRIAQDRHISPSLSSVMALVQAQQGLAGRKTVIYLSSLQQEDIKDAAKRAIDSIIGSANQAGVSINVIDATAFGHKGRKIQGMDNSSEAFAVQLSQASGQGPPGATGGGTFGTGQETLEVVDDAPIDEDLKRLAEGTGGTYFNGDGLKPLNQLVSDMTTYYAASFLPKSQEYDGKLHPLVVKPVRTGLKIRTETGYLALPPPSADGSGVQPFELPLLKLLKETPLPSQFQFKAAILDMGDSEDGRRTTLAIEVPADDLDIQKDANSPSSLAHLTMIADVKDETGATAAHFSSDTPQRVAFHPGAKGADVISLQRHFIVPPGKYTADVLMVETTSGKAAAQRIPFEVLGKSDAPSLGNVILVRRTDPVSPSDDDTTDPLRDDKSRVTPNLTGALPSGDSNVSLFLVVHDNPHSAQPAKLEIRLLHDGQVVGSAPLSAKLVNGGEYLSYLNRFSLSHAPDGTYQVEALLTQDGKTAKAGTSFTLSGLESPDSGPPSDSPSVETIARPAGPLAITVSANAIQRPSDEELKALLAEAAQYANDYWDSLPNFTCEQITERFVGGSGVNKWDHLDTLTGQLNYFDHQEDWTFVEYEKHQKKSHDSGSDNGRGISSAGIFGGVVHGLFRPGAKADITWVETGVLGDGTVQIFKYVVAKENSELYLRAGPTQVALVGYHGMVYIDSMTHAVRRITQVADDVPKKFPIHETLVSADYDYASIGDRQYLLPIGAQIMLRRWNHKGSLELNQIHFRDFHRFRATTKILSSTSTPAP